MAKTEEKLKNLLEEHFQKIKKEEELQMSSRTPGIFAFGVFVGIILSYSNLVGVICGGVIGAVVAINYMEFIRIVVNKGSDFFSSISSRITFGTMQV